MSGQKCSVRARVTGPTSHPTATEAELMRVNHVAIQSVLLDVYGKSLGEARLTERSILTSFQKP